MSFPGFGRYAASLSMAAALLAACGALRQAQDDTPPIGPQGVAPQAPVHAADTGAPCVYLLSTTVASNLSDTHIWGPHCSVYINYTANMSSSRITAAKILYAGAVPKEHGAKFPEATPAPGPIVSDPCSTIPGCAYLMDHSPSTPVCGPAGNYRDVTLSPGCYNRLTLSGTDTLKPGLYVINGPLQLNNSNITGSGVTIYLTANARTTNFSNSTLTLSAPASGDYDGVLFYRPALQSAGINFSSCSCNFTGILYFPSTPVTYSGDGDNYQLLIFGQLSISTSKGIRFGPR